jgi:alkaline phosphatase D
LAQQSISRLLGALAVQPCRPDLATPTREHRYIGVWNDHEVINDFGPLADVGSAPPYPPDLHLLPTGLRAFLDYTPVAEAPRLYRSLRWGRHLELFVLDTRNYRDANYALDSASHPKTMLGREPLAWLKERLASSDATWKVIVSSVPMSIPTGFPPTNGRDGWADFDQATGFENELLDILRFMAEQGIDNPAGSPPTCTSRKRSATRRSPSTPTSPCTRSSPGR